MSKQTEAIEYVKQYMPKTIVGIDSLRLMLLSHHIEKRNHEDAEKAYAGCEKAYEEYQKRQRLMEQVTKR